MGCKVTDDSFEMCPAMKKYAQPATGARQKGIRVAFVTNFKTSVTRYAWTTYHGDSKDKGVVMNVCPWCGENIVPPKTKGEIG